MFKRNGTFSGPVVMWGDSGFVLITPKSGDKILLALTVVLMDVLGVIKLH